MKDNYQIFTNLENIDIQYLNELVSYENANFFHTLKAIDFFKSSGSETFSIGLQRNSKILAFITGVIQKEEGLKSFFSSRAIIYGGPVYDSSVTKDEFSKLLLALIKELKKKVIYIEIRNFNDYSQVKEVYENLNFTYNPHLNFHLECKDENVISSKISKSKLRDIKRSLKEGAEIIEAENLDQITEYYDVLAYLYKHKVKTPLQSLDFFKKLYTQDAAKFLLIKYNDKIIGGVVFAILDNKTVYEWFVCGEDRKYKNIYPSILATWAAIDYANKIGVERFDFMGAGKPDEDYGVRDFKSKFGGTLVEHGRFLFISKPTLYWLGKKAVALLKGYPLFKKKITNVKNLVKVKGAEKSDFIFYDNYEDINIESWKKLNSSSKSGTVFQSPEMFKFWATQKHANPLVFAVKSRSGELMAVCVVVILTNGSGIVKKLSRRGIIFGGPIISNDKNVNEAFQFLLDKMNGIVSSKVIYLETRNSSPYNVIEKSFLSNGWNYLPYQNYLIKLTSEEEIFNKFSSEKRRQIRKSLKEGVHVSYEKSSKNIEEVFSIIKNIYEVKVKKPLPGLDFFKNLCANEFGGVVSIKFKDKTIGGGFYTHDNNCIYDWYRGGLDREFKHQYPSIMAVWAILKLGVEKSKENFDFMGAGLKGQEYGVRNFKSQFGGELVENGRYSKVYNPLLYNAAKTWFKILNR